MAGNLTAKERAIITLTTAGGSLTTGSAGLGNGTADLDARSTGNSPDDLLCRLELVCQWATITGIAAGTVCAECYLLPAPDGTNFPDVDTTSGTSRLPAGAFVCQFEAVKAPTANTNMRFVSPVIELSPMLLRPYILNRSGQTISANWSLKVVPWQGQYT